MNLNPPDSSPQNKVLAVLEAIEAAQYLISRNASHLINRVTAGLLSLFVSILRYVTHTMSSSSSGDREIHSDHCWLLPSVHRVGQDVCECS